MDKNITLKIIDSAFAHAKYSTDFQDSNYLNWTRDFNLKDPDNVVFITDDRLNMVNVTSGKKVAWLIEPRAIKSGAYKFIVENSDKFSKVLTFDKQLLDLLDNAEFYPIGGCWIKPEDQKIYDKSKLLSTIVSNKRMTFGHKLRHDYIKYLLDNGQGINLYGKGYNQIDYKLTALKDYAFSLTIENSSIDYYFTEKLIDCFRTGTVPVYWGCPSISDFFNTDGMIIVKDKSGLLSEVERLSLDRYKEMLPAIEENFEKAKKYLIAEDWIYENLLINILSNK